MVALLATGSGNLNLFGGVWRSFFTGYGVSAGYDPAGGAQGYAIAIATAKAPMIVHPGAADGLGVGALPWTRGGSLICAPSPGRWRQVPGALDVRVSCAES